MTRRARTVVWSTVAAAGAALVIGSVAAWQFAQPSTTAGESLASIRSAAAATASASGTAPTTGTASSATRPAATAGPAVPDTAASTPLAAPPATRDADPGALAAPAPTPVRVVVESLGIDAAIDPVGVQDDGSMSIPASASRVGWYSYGPAPSDPAGNTVLAGHVDTRAEGPGALYNLREAEVGTRIVVEDAAGVAHEYEVAGKESIVKAALPVDQIFARDGRPLLVMITCGGEFQPALRSYRDNLVITAVPVTTAPAGAGTGAAGRAP